MTLVAGADITKGRWVVVVLRNGGFHDATVVDTLDVFLDHDPDVEIIAADIPIGLPTGKGCRQCDLAAKRFLKPNSATVFLAPPKSIVEAPTYKAANDLSWQEYGRGVSAQAYALRTKILEVAPIAAKDERVVEAHPEVCFRAMKKSPLQHGKKSWNGQIERRAILGGRGIRLPNHLERAGDVPPDDLLDAAAAAWTAWRVAEGEAKVLPESAQGCTTKRRSVIWY
jgi:predicted RNase H-like nuclease